MVPVFGGGDRRNLDNDNFYLSQVRICVEMAFGMMVNWFGLLKSPLRVSVQNVGPLLQCVARLHNFMLDRSNSYRPQTRGPAAPEMVPHKEEVGRYNNGYLPQYVYGISAVHEVLVRRVKEAVLVQPKNID